MAMMMLASSDDDGDDGDDGKQPKTFGFYFLKCFLIFQPYIQNIKELLIETTSFKRTRGPNQTKNTTERAGVSVSLGMPD